MTLQVELAHEKCQHHIDGGKDPELVRQMVMEIARGHVYNAADTSLRSNRQKRVGA